MKLDLLLILFAITTTFAYEVPNMYYIFQVITIYNQINSWNGLVLLANLTNALKKMLAAIHLTPGLFMDSGHQQLQIRLMGVNS